MEVLLEVVAEGEVEEGALVCGQLHRGCEAALDDGEVAGGEVAVEVVHVGAHFEAVVLGQAFGVDAGAGDDDHPEVGHALFRFGEGVDDAAEEVGADAGAADGDDADLFVVLVAELGAVAERARVEAGDVAGES